MTALTRDARTDRGRGAVPRIMFRLSLAAAAAMLISLAIAVDNLGFALVAAIFLAGSLFSGWAADSSPVVCLGHVAACDCGANP